MMFETSTVTFDWRRVVARHMVDMRFVATHAEMVRWEEEATMRLALELRSYVLSRRINTVEKTETVKVPASWWDHFKQEQVDATSPLWRWVARRWPPQHRTVRVTARVEVLDTYPNADITVPRDRFGDPVRVVVPA